MSGTGFVRSLRCLLLFWWAATSPCIALAMQIVDPAQTDFPGLDIQAVAGWDGYVDPAAPVPFSFLISNFSPDTIEGELTLREPESERILSLGEVFIGSNQRSSILIDSGDPGLVSVCGRIFSRRPSPVEA